MVSRTLLVLSAVLLLSACTSKDDAVDTAMPTGTQGPGGSTFDANGTPPVNGVVPGSQQDLVVNVGDRIFFSYDQSDVSTEARTTLDKQVAWLKQYPNVNITIEGHADERGTREYNLALGERRANSVKSYILSQGIAATRVNTISYGKERPAVAEPNPAGWAQNRRAVTVVN